MKAPVLLHVPHASRFVPGEHRSLFVVSDAELEAELLCHTDAYTDSLFELESADRVVFPVSRLLVDPERFRKDEDEVMASRGLGAVYTRTADGRPLKNVSDREALLLEFYDPHHQKLEAWVENALRHAESCLIIDGHSFPSVPLPCDLDQRPNRPDYCLGTDPFHTPSALIEAAQDALAQLNASVEVNRPYAGTIVPISRYRKDPRVRSIMLEVNRRLYMEEGVGTRSSGFADVQDTVSRVLQALASA